MRYPAHSRIQRIGNKIVFTLLIILCVLVLTSCPAISDWAYEDLPNGYVLDSPNSKSRDLLNANGTVFLDGYITKISYNDRYIGIVCVADYDYSTFDYENIEDYDLEYKLVDTIQGEIVGDFATVTEYNSQINSLSIVDMTEWQNTDDIAKEQRKQNSEEFDRIFPYILFRI